MVPIDEECIKILQVPKLNKRKSNKELGIKNRYKMIFQHYGYIHLVPDIASVNKALSVLLNELDIYPIITTKGSTSYLWKLPLAQRFDLELLQKF